jgi:hypothetical protein
MKIKISKRITGPIRATITNCALLTDKKHPIMMPLHFKYAGGKNDRLGATYVQGNKVIIELNKHQCREEMLDTILHELVHASQMSTGKLSMCQETFTVKWHRWPRISFKTYMKIHSRTPWERQAVKFAKITVANILKDA